MDEERTTSEEVTVEVVTSDHDVSTDDGVPVSDDSDEYVEDNAQENDGSTSTTSPTSSNSAGLTLEDVREVVSDALRDYAEQQEREFEQLTMQVDEVGAGVLRLQGGTSGGQADENDVQEATPDGQETNTGYALDADQWAVVRDGVKVVSTCAVFELCMVAALGGLLAWQIVSGGWRHA